ncbi:hypothetical protein, partial [[Mycobacterium] crassicus]
LWVSGRPVALARVRGAERRGLGLPAGGVGVLSAGGRARRDRGVPWAATSRMSQASGSAAA